MPTDALTLARVFVCLFFAGTFIQSGIDKIVDWKGNLEWLTGHFSKTRLRGQVPMMLGTVTLLEVAAGLFALVSAVALLLRGPMELGVAAMALSCLTLVMLLVGQRIAKDYAGAGTLAAYFMIALFGLWLMGPTLP